MNYKYEETFSIRGYEVDFNNQLFVSSMFDYMQQTAGFHADTLGFGYDNMTEKGLYWVLSRVVVDIHSYPSYGNQVKVTTWPKGIDKLLALRDFILEDGKGHLIGKGTSAWIVMDMKRRRPVRPPKEFIFQVSDHAIEAVPEKIIPPDDLKEIFTHKVGYSEIDVNKHVNNVNYVRWVQNCFGEEQYKQKNISHIQVNFLCECALNHNMRIMMHEDSNENYYVEGFNETLGQKAFSSTISWKNK